MLTLATDPTTLLRKALLERGEALAVIADPGEGEDAIIVGANEPWSRAIGQPNGLLGRPIRDLRPHVVEPGQWSAFATALRRYAPIQLLLQLRVEGRERWLQVRLTFDEDASGYATQALLLGRDITKLRRREAKEEVAKRLTGAIFLDINAPVVVVAETGEIVMSNPAFQALLDYSEEQLLSLAVADLVAPDHQVEAAAARAKQLRDGARFENRIDLLHRTGSRISVRITSTLLAQEDGCRLRVITALAETVGRIEAAAGASPKLDLYGAPAQLEGEVLAISLKGLKAACASEWARLAPRATLVVEGSIKRRLRPTDVFSRTDDDGFVIWFHSRHSAHNAAVLASIVRDVRLRLIVELGDEIPAPAMAVLASSDPAANAAFSPALLDPAPSTGRPAVGVSALPVMDRDGKVRPWCLAELATVPRRRVSSEMASPEGSADADLQRFDAALAAACANAGWEKVFVRVGWQCLANLDSRRLLDDRLARAPSAARCRLALVVSGVPPVPSPKRWLDVVASLRPLLADVIPCVTLASGDQDLFGATVCTWPVGWIAIDGADPQSMPPDGYFALIATARRREMTVLARAATAADVRDWTELGASLIVVAT